MTAPRLVAALSLVLLPLTACSDDGGGSTGTATTSTSTVGTTSATTTVGTATTTTMGGETTSAGPTTDTPTGSATGTATEGSTSAVTATTGVTSNTTDTAGTTSGTDTGTGSTGGGCGVCDQPNQECVDNVCVTSCQGQDPSPCPQDQVCDVISGDCVAPDATCKLAGGEAACGAKFCGPGSICDGVGECLPIAPCANVDCTADGHCWGSFCSCNRAVDCQDPALDKMNGPFSVEIGGIDFADDCTAWMVTLRSGPDYLRRLTPAGDLTQWTGVANLNMGEVKVLRRLTIPQLTTDLPLAALPGQPDVNPEPLPVEGLGEVAITYTCCPTCGCQANPPQGVARLVEEDMNNPLPIVIIAKATQGSGPFGNTAADAGPHGLTWGEDRVLYVGNSTNNGEYNTADLDKMTQDIVYTFETRVSASAPVSPVHLLVAQLGGKVFRFNTLTKQTELVAELMANVTAFSHDSFTGHVYASLSTLDVVRIEPFTGEVTPFQKMPGKGRVAVSPSGKLWFTPVKYVNNLPLSTWDLPMSF